MALTLHELAKAYGWDQLCSDMRTSSATLRRVVLAEHKAEPVEMLQRLIELPRWRTVGGDVCLPSMLRRWRAARIRHLAATRRRKVRQ